MRATSLLLAVVTLLAPAACASGKDAPATERGLDSSAVTAAPGSASPAALDSAAPAVPDSARIPAPAGAVTPGPTRPATKTPAKPDSMIGRDSAFGPTYGVDPKGNVTPLKPKP